MDFDIPSFVLGAVTGSVVVLAIVYPRLGRIAVRMLSTVFIAGGVGLLACAIDAFIRGNTLSIMVGIGQYKISEPNEATGAGAALLVGGVLALLLSFLGRSDRGSLGRSDRGSTDYLRRLIALQRRR